ncbi:MAG: protein kinase, partial [Chloroflexota bacterium]|nr:protein kinase [Chloroflexota bacterium]
MLEINLLGRFEVRLDGEPLELSSHPAQTLLAYLLLNAGITHRREQVAGLLWPDSLDSSARKNLRNAIYQVRQAIGERYLLSDKRTLAFDTSAPHELDVARLEDSAVERDTEALMQAVALYQGELLPGFYEDWIQLERERLRALFERRAQRLLEQLETQGRWREVQQWAEHWIALGHVPEPAYRALMTACAAQGDLAGMASAYRRCVQALEEEVGVPPSPETQTLYERLSRGEVPITKRVSDERVVTTPSPAERYTTDERLAVGGQGEVYLGTDRLSGEPVIIKRLRSELVADQEKVARFIREGEALRQLNHPNIVGMLATFEQDDRHCLVMEYVPGGTLRDLLDKEGALPLKRVLAIA